MVYVTHDQVEAMTLADRIVVLRAGQVEQVGTPLALFDDPDNLFVAQFIGSPRMNTFPARAVAGGGVRLEGFDCTLPFPGAATLVPGQGVVVGCRPDHFVLSGEPGLLLEVAAVEQLGSVSVAHAQVSGAPMVAVELRDGRALRPGDRLAVGFPPARTLFFDAATGLRLR